MTVYSYCAGTNSGQLCAIASGGTPNYNYVWNDMLGQTTSCAINLIANQYTVIVMDDRNCIASASFNLDSITNTMILDSIDMTIVATSCFGDYNGSVTINSVGGAVAPFTYNWTPAVGTTNTITSLYAGSYAVVIEDSNGCALTVNAEVGEPDRLEYTIYNVIDETCFGACDGQMWVNVEGGTGNYYYDDTEVGDFTIPFPNPVQLINDSLIYDLCSGLHSIYITDDNNCEGAVVWGGVWQEFVDSGVVVIAPLVNHSDASCANSYDGTAWIPWPGADPLFTYTWETFPITTTIDTGVSTSILYPGDYVLVAHYADSASFGQVYSGCDISSAVFTIGSPAPIISGANPTDVLCYGDVNGSITLSPTGGIGPYSFSWDTTTSIPSPSTQQNQSPLQPGTYTVTITDASGCDITEDITVGEPDPITSSFNITQVSCFGVSDGSATVVALGGTAGYLYSWSPSGGNAATAINLSAGVYTVNVTDANGCPASFSVTLDPPDEIIASVDINKFYGEYSPGNPYHISCFGFSDGEAIVSNGGGTPPISYSWSSGGSSQQETGIPAGPVTVTVTDANNCFESKTITLVQPDYLDPNIYEYVYSTSTNGITNEISCYGLADGWVESNTIGGVDTGGIVTSYQYLWINDNTGITVSNVSVAENLPANSSYTVTVTDANGCVSQATTTILDEPALFNADVTTTNYGGPAHAPFTVNFVDNTVCIDPYYLNWTWGSGDPANGTSSMNHEFTINNLGLNNVYVVLTNEATGCTDSVPFIIEAQGVAIPNVFTPGTSIGINDYFVFGINQANPHYMNNLKIDIYNRWGQLVMYFDNLPSGWLGWDGYGADGEKMPEGVYFFVLTGNGIDGHYYEEEGSVTLLR